MPSARRRSIAQAHVVFLVNFLSPNLVEVFREVRKRVGRLHILVSVPMEANRQWSADNYDLPVVVQRTWTRRKVVSHPGGYNEELFVHFPWDTLGQLIRLRPDCVVSLEMGVRSALSSVYRRLIQRRCRHVLAVYGSERSEAGRGGMRRRLRRRLLGAADVITFNGPSCERYLLAQGADRRRMVPWNYAADPSKAYRGPLQIIDRSPVRLLTVSQLIPRKGVELAARSLNGWAQQNPSHSLQWAIAGTGPQAAIIEALDLTSNLKINLLGHCEASQLRELYSQYPVHFFPTLGDEWGLVVDEALASGQVVLGSIYSQAVETLVTPGENGWHYDPEQPLTLQAALESLSRLEPSSLLAMRQRARESVALRTHVESGEQFVSAVTAALAI